jgi:hypothetical protein
MRATESLQLVPTMLTGDPFWPENRLAENVRNLAPSFHRYVDIGVGRCLRHFAQTISDTLGIQAERINAILK